MKFLPTKLAGVWIVELEPNRDERGFFARSWCQKEFAAQGLDTRLVQCNIAFSPKRGTLRGIHYQAAPHPEVKLVRCTRGAVYDVVVDIRRNSPTFKRWLSVELTPENERLIYIPEGCAHAYQTLTDNSEVFYQMSEFYHPELARGVRFNDPELGIEWPLPNPIVSDRDRALPCVAEL